MCLLMAVGSSELQGQQYRLRSKLQIKAMYSETGMLVQIADTLSAQYNTEYHNRTLHLHFEDVGIMLWPCVSHLQALSCLCQPHPVQLLANKAVVLLLQG